MGGRVIMGKRRGHDLSLRDPAFTANSLLAIVGAASLMTGLTRAAVLWFPTRLASDAWIFTTVRLTLAELPLLGLGAALLCVGLARLPLNPAWTRGGAASFALLAAAAMALGAVFVPASSAAVAGAPPEALEPMRREIISGLATLALFSLGFAGSAVVLWLAVEKNA